MRVRHLDLLPKQLAFAWYDKDQWNQLRDLSVDPEDLDDSFEEWETAAIQAEAEFLAKGCDVRRVSVTAAELVAWCQRNAHPLNRAARSAFVAERAHLYFPARND